MNIEQMMQEARESGLDYLGRVAYEAWCHSGRRIPSPWDLKDIYEKAMWIESVKAVAALVRAQALEEAAEVCEHLMPLCIDPDGTFIPLKAATEHIRALKASPDAGEG